MGRRPKISFALPLQFGMTVLSKAHKYDTQWVKLTGEEICNLKIKDLLGDVRVVFEGKVDGQRVWIATYTDDFLQLKAKYKCDLVLHVGQIYKALAGENPIIESVLMPAAILEATVL